MLDDHYFAAHPEAFSDEELHMARMARLRTVGPVKGYSSDPCA